MRFAAKTEDQLNEERMLPEGEYPFEISAAEETTSAKGNEMIKLLVRVFKPDGQFILVNDYLLEIMQFKLLHCSEACGLADKYDTGELAAEDFIGKTGKLKLGQDPAKGDFPAKNSIKDYIADSAGEKPPKDALEKVGDKDELEDSIPF